MKEKKCDSSIDFARSTLQNYLNSSLSIQIL
jgi:hypothetical protein